jgi:hypothetical protein
LAKLNWGLQQEALNTRYKGAILPLILYGTPLWIQTMEKNYNRTTTELQQNYNRTTTELQQN